MKRIKYIAALMAMSLHGMNENELTSKAPQLDKPMYESSININGRPVLCYCGKSAASVQYKNGEIEAYCKDHAPSLTIIQVSKQDLEQSIKDFIAEIDAVEEDCLACVKFIEEQEKE